MGMLEDVMRTLERIPLWKRLAELPDQVTALQTRVHDLEQRLAGKTGPLCPICNAPGFKRTASKPDPIAGDLGIMQDSYECGSCGHAETRQRDTMAG